jgi:hypothetical protein
MIIPSGGGSDRGLSEWEQATAISPAGEKKRVRASGASGSVSATQWVGRPESARKCGVAKTRPSVDR